MTSPAMTSAPYIDALDNVQKWVMQQRIALHTNDPDFHPKYETLKAVGKKIREEKDAALSSLDVPAHPEGVKAGTGADHG